VAFDVTEVFDAAAIRALLAGAPARATPVDVPFRKDYDSYPGNTPRDWPARFAIERWLVFAAYADGARIGGATLVVDDPGIDLLADRSHAALLWDLRVAPAFRGRGVGTALLEAVERAAERRGADLLRVETQNVNVPVCRFYQRRGLRLQQAVAEAYPDLPGEWQLLWDKTLHRHRPDDDRTL
jgi:GNAT superfamily N-acetyltransferase